MFPPWLWEAPGLPDLDHTVFRLDHACMSLGSKCHWIDVTEDHDKRYTKISCSVSGYSHSGLPCCPHWRRRHGEKLPPGLRTVSEKKATPMSSLRGYLPDFPTVSLLATTFSVFPLWQREASSAAHREEDEKPTGSLEEAGSRNPIRSILLH